MRLIEYTPDRFDALRKAAARIEGNWSLRHQPFVDYYYTANDWNRLYLLFDDGGSIQGLVGIDRLPFEYESRPVTFGFASNFHGLRPGVGGLLFLHWLKTCSPALVLAATESTHRIVRQQHWTYFPDVKIYSLNHDYPVYPTDNRIRAAAKWAARRTTRQKISAYSLKIPARVREEIAVREESNYTRDLLPVSSPFVFRMAPTVEYLNWRYSTQLSFVTYRLFRILNRGETAGYVVLNESADRILVAQCDGASHATLAYGVLHSLLAVGEGDQKPRTVILTCSNPLMSSIYVKFGFRPGKNDWPVAIGSLREPVHLSRDTSNWLLNYDTGDIGLIGPFPGQESAVGTPSPAPA